jgi:predicted AlkP superfamily phosphohydrolase/phosphomutase
MGHRFVPGVDPTGSEYDAAAADARWEVIRAYYRAADRFVGAFLNRLDDGETAFAVVSDHGMPANAKAVSLVNLFLERGWITPSADGRGVDWTRSRVFFAQNHLWVNLRGRDAGGIVDAIDYDPLRRQVLAALRDLKDADTGEHVLAFALPREEAAVVGLWGEYIGDIVFCYAGGYRWSGPEVLGLGERRPVFPCGGGNHGPMIPTYETATTSVLGALILAGPGVRSARARARLDQLSVRATDLAPTLAHLLGLPTPAQNEGRVLGEFLQDHDCSAPVRRLQSLSRPVVRRRAAAPKAKGLQGDVTDEA